MVRSRVACARWLAGVHCVSDAFSQFIRYLVRDPLCSTYDVATRTSKRTRLPAERTISEKLVENLLLTKESSANNKIKANLATESDSSVGSSQAVIHNADICPEKSLAKE